MDAKAVVWALAIATGCLTSEAQLQWTTNNNEITVTGAEYGIEADLRIPETITGLPVTSIGPSAFYNQGTITNVTIADSVRDIGMTAFAYCGQLQSISFGNGVTNLGYHALFSSTKLASITVAAANPAFESNEGVLFDKGQQTLLICPPQRGGAYTVGKTVNRIGPGAFDHCIYITSLNLPAGVTDIETGAFNTCSALRNVTLNEGLRRIANLGFANCTSVTNITIPNSTTNINGAFDMCYGLASATLGTNLVDIGGAFRLCDHLQSISIPNKVIDLGDLTFAGCARLTNATLPQGLVRIGSAAFSQCAMTSLTLPNGLQTIERYAFEWCTLLRLETVPSTVTNLAQSAFRECHSLTTFAIPDSVLNLGESAFNNCPNLAIVTVGKGLNTIDLTPFSSCGRLGAIIVDPQNTSFSSLDGVLFNKAQTRLVCFPEAKIGSYRIPASVGTIGRWAFDRSKLTSVTVPNTVTNLESGAFNNCNNLSAVWFEGNAPTVSSYALGNGNRTAFYYFPGTTNWNDTLDGKTVWLWNPRMGGASIGPEGLGFHLTGSANLTVVVEAKDGLEEGAWRPMQTNTLYNGTENFKDSSWTNTARRFYRLRSP